MMGRGLDPWAPFAVFALLLLPFVNILHFALPLPLLFGKSAWLMLPVGMLTFSYLWIASPQGAGRWRRQRPALFAAGILLLAYFVRAFVYGEPAFPTHLHFAVTMIVYLGLAEALLCRREAVLPILSRALVLQGLLVSLLVFVNMNFFPAVRLEADENGLVGLTTKGILTRSMLINATVAANHVLCAMFALYATFRHRREKSARALTAFWFAIIFMAYVISLLGSRYPITVALLLISVAAYELRGARSFVALLGAVFMLVVLDFGVAGVQNMFIESGALKADSLHTAKPILRFDENSGSRLEKTRLAIRMLGDSAKNFAIGPSTYETETSTTDYGVKFSDNSYAMLMLYVGVPAALLFFALWIWYLRRYARSPLALFCLAYLAGTLLLTNGLLWESWVCSILFTLAVVAGYAGGTRADEGHTPATDAHFRIFSRSSH